MEPFIQYYPVMIDLRDKLCVVVGGGSVAHRKVCSLLESGARVRVISPRLCSELEAGRLQGLFEYMPSGYSENALEGAFLVVGSTDDDSVNREVGAGAARRGLLVNIVDDPENSNFIVPSILRRGRLSIAISTGGASPAYARRLKEHLESRFISGHADFLDIMAELRSAILAEIGDGKVRRRIFEGLSAGPLLDAVLRRSWGEVPDLIESTIENESGKRISGSLREAILRAVRARADSPIS